MKEDDFEIKFWKDWLYADTLERIALVEKLPIIKEFIDMPTKIKDKKMLKHILVSNLNGFFEDLESAVYTKIEIDKKKKSK